MMNIHIDMTFPHEYSIDLNDTISLSGGKDVETYYYPGASKIGGKDGISIKVNPINRATWIGIFAFGYRSPVSLTSVYSTPNPNVMCVISSGAGYMVDVKEPSAWQEIKLNPITDVHPILSNCSLIFVGFTEILSYDINGLAWETSRLAYDNVRITAITSEVIRGTGWHAPSGQDREFVIDINTGRHSGDAYP